MNEERAFKGIWIPAVVWCDERLTVLDKIILAEIDSLDVDDGCYASNEYLASFCQCSKTKIALSIAKLKEYGYITLASFDGRKRILHSCIYSENENANFQKMKGGISKKCKSDFQKVKCLHLKNNIDNNIVDNSITCSALQKCGLEKIIDDYTTNSELRDALEEFVKMRTKIKKPLTERALKSALKHLDKLADTESRKIATVDQTLEHCWQTFYAVKEEVKPNGNNIPDHIRDEGRV